MDLICEATSCLVQFFVTFFVVAIKTGMQKSVT